MWLTKIKSDNYSYFAKEVSDNVNLALHPKDGMFCGNEQHYLKCGASALNIIDIAVQRAEIQPRSILDFGSGAGRVTRWLRAAYPDAEIWVTDTREEDLTFCQHSFDVSSFLSFNEVSRLHSPSSYDLIWVGSVLTHLSETTSWELTRKLASWLNPGGALVLSAHGRFARGRAAEFGNYGIENGWDKLISEVEAHGFGYADYPNQVGYGISICTLSWLTELVERIGGARLIFLSERAWDNHHDVVALQMRDINQSLSLK
jgi:2-polyprenyl-3-methyl-5-hydroxy-6-metoxy-1,4-benzoquinol methylase